MNKKRGFTLIELLVVIAIIGILATIVLVNLNTARNKAKSAAIKAALSEARAAAELWYDSQTINTYVGFCASTDGTRIRQNISDNGGTPIATLPCFESITAFCMQSTVPAPAGEKRCADSKGFTGIPSADCAVGNIECD